MRQNGIFRIASYTDAMTRLIQVPDSIYEEIEKWFSEQQLVELTALIAGYNMVSRFLEALEINTEGEMNYENSSY